MKGLIIDNVDTLTAYGLILGADVVIGSPEVKTAYIDIQGANGAIDFSESVGGLCYKNRTISFSLVAPLSVTEKRSQFMDAFHGKRAKIWLPDDLTHYYEGRISVGDSTQNGRIPCTLNASPYKLKNAVTVSAHNVRTSGTIIINNECMPVCPKVTVSSACTIEFDGRSVSLAAGSYTIPQLVLKQGANEIAVTGSATITFEYQEGRF